MWPTSKDQDQVRYDKDINHLGQGSAHSPRPQLSMPIKNALWYVLWLQRATNPVGTRQQQEETSRLPSLRIVIGNMLAGFGPKINGNTTVHVHVVRKNSLREKKKKKTE